MEELNFRSCARVTLSAESSGVLLYCLDAYPLYYERRLEYLLYNDLLTLVHW